MGMGAVELQLHSFLVSALDGSEESNHAPVGIRTPDGLARSPVTIPTMISRLCVVAVTNHARDCQVIPHAFITNRVTSHLPVSFLIYAG
jgi:hypothetical protein